MNITVESKTIDQTFRELHIRWQRYALQTQTDILKIEMQNTANQLRKMWNNYPELINLQLHFNVYPGINL
jgi:hypothetical protein